MAAPTTNPYLKTEIMTASPAQLRQMLLDGAVRYLDEGKTALAKADHEGTYNGISRCQEIVMELLNGLRPDKSPELCERLSSLYTFIYLQLVKALTDRDLAVAEEVLTLLKYEQETWRLLAERLAQENAAGAEAADAVADDAAKADPPSTPTDAGGLVGGYVSVKA